jgi:hypothetical protein
MAPLGHLKDLWTLELNGCPISHEGVKELSQLTSLLSLGLRNSGIENADLEVLDALPQIDILRLGRN